MKPLPTTFRKDGYNFRLLDRVDDVALFEKSCGGHVSWETVVVQKYGERTIAGNAIPATEAMPPATSWGQKGWTLTTIERAREKLAEIVERERRKEAAK